MVAILSSLVRPYFEIFDTVANLPAAKQPEIKGCYAYVAKERYGQYCAKQKITQLSRRKANEERRERIKIGGRMKIRY